MHEEWKEYMGQCNTIFNYIMHLFLSLTDFQFIEGTTFLQLSVVSLTVFQIWGFQWCLCCHVLCCHVLMLSCPLCHVLMSSYSNVSGNLSSQLNILSALNLSLCLDSTPHSVKKFLIPNDVPILNLLAPTLSYLTLSFLIMN